LDGHYHEPMTTTGAPPAHHDVVLHPSGTRFDADPGQTLLACAALAGIAWPSSCRNGTCRTCITPLLAGTVDYRIPWPGLLPEERGAWVLPCVAYPRSDLVLGDAGLPAPAPQ
jgi:ferredoxin